MAKKSVASLQTGAKRLTKAIKMVKSPKQELTHLLKLLWILQKLTILSRKIKTFTQNK